MATNTKKRSIPYETYFDEMGINKIQKEDRIEFSEKMEDIVLAMMSYIVDGYVDESFDEEKVKQESISEFLLLASMYVEIEIPTDISVALGEIENTTSVSFGATDIMNGKITIEDVIRHSNNLFTQLIDTTIQHFDDDYYTSVDRAKFIAEDEANTFLNQKEFADAINNGMMYKTWHTMKDERVRSTHAKVESKKIPINELFVVGDSLMAYPKDNTHGASDDEIVNCRCWVIYSK